MPRFLVVADEMNALAALRELLEMDGHQVAAFGSAPEASAALKASVFDVVLTDLEIPHAPEQLVPRLSRQLQPAACIFAITARSAPRTLDGACHVFEKPLDYGCVARAVATCRADEGGQRRGGCHYTNAGCAASKS